MCMNLRRFCSCGRNSASLSCRDNLLPAEILVNLFCPGCRPGSINEATMLADCGWVLEYDVDRAQAYFTTRGIRSQATPNFIFDAGYLSWQGWPRGTRRSTPGCTSGWRPSLSRIWPFISKHCVLSGSPTRPGSRPQVGARPRPPEALP